MRNLAVTLLTGILAVPAFAQTSTREAIAQGQLNTLLQAQQVVSAAERAGAGTYATTLLEDARFRLRSAQDKWNSDKRQDRELARLYAEQAIWGGRAALAKTQWLATNAAVRGLQTDISRFGGRTDLSLREEPTGMEIDRGQNSRDRIVVAEAAIAQARAAGGERIMNNDLSVADENIRTAKKITRNDKNNTSADHLAYIAEMIARRAYYLARAGEVNSFVPNLQIERTRLAQAESMRQAELERVKREAAEREAAELNRRLMAEQANRDAQASELARLRGEVEATRLAMESRVSSDRTAREEAERRLDEMMQRYQAALSSSSSADAESLRRQVEDQQITLRAIQERERLNEQSLQAQVDSLRRDLETARRQGPTGAQIVAERQAELERREQEYQRLRREREEDLARRTTLDQQSAALIAEAQRTRQAAESQALELRQQVQAAQQVAQAAQQQTQQTQAELDRARAELATRDVETRRLRMEQELSRLAATRTDERGLIVTLPGIFFDTGKAVIKAGSRNTLSRIAEQLQTDASLRIEVEGHTDSVGSTASNLSLSERRARAVRDFLAANGIPADRITSIGRGESSPIAGNTTASGRQQNRRVELVISNATMAGSTR